MKATFIFLSILSFLLFTSNSFSQDEYAVPFLTFPVSPVTTGMGVTGASLPNDDPFGFLLNPAQLGHISQSTNLSFSFYPGSSEIWGLEDFTFNSFAINLGYNLKDDLNFPISVGLGYARTNYTIDYWGYQNDIYSTFSLGVGIDYGVQFNAGLSLKHISSELSDRPTSQTENTAEASITALDFGLLFNVPVIKLIDKNLQFDIFENNPLLPFFNFSTGYSQLNNGDEIYYIDPAQADPLPRIAKLGYGLSAGLNINMNQTYLKVIGFDFSVDAEDLLVDRKFVLTPNDTSVSNEYQSFIGDIKIGKNIIAIEGDDKVVTKAGFELELFEIFSYRQGHLSGRGLNNVKTNGFEIKSSGLLKIIAPSNDENPLKYLSDHFDLRFSYSNYSIFKDMETDYYSISIFVRNINSLF